MTDLVAVTMSLEMSSHVINCQPCHLPLPIPLRMLSVLTRSPAIKLRQQALSVRAFHASTPARSSGHGHYHVRRLSQTIFTILKQCME